MEAKHSRDRELAKPVHTAQRYTRERGGWREGNDRRTE